MYIRLYILIIVKKKFEKNFELKIDIILKNQY